MRLYLTLVLAIVPCVLLTPHRADACSPPQDYALNETLPAGGLTGVPTIGIVPIYVGIGDAANLVVTVTDASGNVAPGTYELRGRTYNEAWMWYFSGRLIWSADSPLAPNTAYTMTLTSETGYQNDGPLLIPFATRATETPSTPAFTIDDTGLSEDSYASDEVCCGEPSIDTCGFATDTDCWPTESTTSHSLHASLRFSADEGRYSEFDVSLDGAAPTRIESANQAAYLYAGIAELAEQHCLTITMTNLVDANATTQTTCTQTRDMVRNTPPTLYPVDVCDDPNVDPPDEDPQQSHGGCSASSHGTPHAAIMFALALLLAARRRRVTSRRN